MKRALGYLFAASLLLFALNDARADLAPAPSPQKPGKIVLHTSLSVVPDSKAYQARLQISQDSLNEIRAALGEVPGNGSSAQSLAHNSQRTIIAGLSLFLALSFGGVWLARSAARRSQKAMAAVLTGVAVLGAAAVITRANAGPPPAFRWRGLPQNLSEGRATSGGVDIEIVPEGNGMKLIIPLQKKSGE
ncbi:MAG TPA: hypothetical protein VFV61_00345 [Pyrinomonadaceae bacterium]|nr:hypothetical protein [Pyrinomonadaceae bacterium]